MEFLPDAAAISALFDGLDVAAVEAALSAPRALRCARIGDATGMSQAAVARRLAEKTGLPFDETFKAADCPSACADPSWLHEYACVPGSGSVPGGPLVLMTSWPAGMRESRWVAAMTGTLPEWRMAPPEAVETALREAFGVGAGSLDGEGPSWADAPAAEEVEDDTAAIIRFVRDVIARAAEDRATDIHFEPRDGGLRIRYRIDGELVPVPVPANLGRFQAAILSRLKIMAKLDIAERRKPQDGRIGFEHAGEAWDIRVSTLPSLHGESVSLRLLAAKAEPPLLVDLGFLPDDVRLLEAHLTRPHGIILVTGPTGSGKSTTLNACLRRVRAPNLRLMSVEDPIEYRVDEVIQTQVQPETGLTFAQVLRSVLRQDPDVIMVGEIRDRETADIAIRASLTGHLVLSTLHTNDAPGAVTRLTDMGVEPFLIASALELVVAQRLVRRLCPKCAHARAVDTAVLARRLTALGLNPEEASRVATLVHPKGCEHCRNIGYKGRLAIAEMLCVDDEVHSLVVNRAPAGVIREAALRGGMRPLQSCGWEQVKRGLTSLEEVMAYAEQPESDH